VIVTSLVGAVLAALGVAVAGAAVYELIKIRVVVPGFCGRRDSSASVRWHGASWLAVGMYGLVSGIWFIAQMRWWLPEASPVVGYLGPATLVLVLGCRRASRVAGNRATHTGDCARPAS
jgi:hypothetical protein